MERGEILVPAQQRDPELASPPPPGRERCLMKDCPGDLLSTIADLAGVLPQENVDGMPRTSVAVSRARETVEAHAAREPAKIQNARDSSPAKTNLPPAALQADQDFPLIQEFAAAGGDWEVFCLRFSVNFEVARWTEEEALRALPLVLDDDALAAFDAIPDNDKATLTQALQQMGAIFAPLSMQRHKFAMLRREEDEPPLAYRAALLFLAKSAYPKMDHVGWEYLILDKMLLLARDLQVVLPYMDDDDLTSFQVAQCLQTHFNATRKTAKIKNARNSSPTKTDLPPTALQADRDFPLFREFTAASGDWEAFCRRFSAAFKLVGWTEEKALLALPLVLDDDALAAFDAIPDNDKATLTQALQQMGAIFAPLSMKRHKFAMRRQREAETPLAYRIALLSLAKSAYPKMDQVGWDGLVLDKMLPLARDLQVVLPDMDDDLASLQVARCLQAHFHYAQERAKIKNARDLSPAKTDLPPTALQVDRYLPFREFTAAGGDWEAFCRRFSTAFKLAGWTEEQALLMLPLVLDDDALAVFRGIPYNDKATVTQALAQMGEIFAPPSMKHHKFAMRRQGEAETPLAYRAALLSLAKSAYPQMDQVGWDFLVLEKMLPLAQEVQVVLPVMVDNKLTSLQFARCLEAHFHTRWHVGVLASTGPATGKRLLQWKGSEEYHQGVRDRPRGAFPCPRDDPIVCFKCGLPGHVAKRCRAQRGGLSKSTPSADRRPFSPQGHKN
ncbi:uncharacterized protein LOC144735528 [Lampetra planeri]